MPGYSRVIFTHLLPHYTLPHDAVLLFWIHGTYTHTRGSFSRFWLRSPPAYACVRSTCITHVSCLAFTPLPALAAHTTAVIFIRNTCTRHFRFLVLHAARCCCVLRHLPASQYLPATCTARIHRSSRICITPLHWDFALFPTFLFSYHRFLLHTHTIVLCATFLPEHPCCHHTRVTVTVPF